MKKRIVALVLAVLMLLPTAAAADTYTQQEKTADAMNHLGLFQGTGTEYELDGTLRRDHGVILLVRMMGKEEEAVAKAYKTPFADVLWWAADCIGYAYTHKITNGVGPDRETGEELFGSTSPMTDNMFLTLTLRALGYTDSEEEPQFDWRNPYDLAKEIGLIASTEKDDSFTRGDAVEVFWNALNASFAGTDVTLAQSLVQQGVFTAEAYAQAQEIQKNGRAEYQGVPAVPGETETPDPVDPAPVDPEPVDPTPVDPTPVDPAPVDPDPVDPDPVDPDDPSGDDVVQDGNLGPDELPIG